MLKKITAFSFAALVFASYATAQTQQSPIPQGYNWPGPWHYGWPFWWMFPMMILFFFVVCAVVIFFARGMCAGGPSHWGPRMWHDPTQSALQILNERFARGEIQKEEYGDRKATILSGGR